jgi:CubicO group peptidase (beta-lactamase class C family)
MIFNLRTILMRGLGLALALMLLLPALQPAGLAHEPGPEPPATVRELEHYIREILEREGVPGIILSIVEDGQESWRAGIGLADIESRLPVSEDTIFRIGSISKMFASIAVMQLVEQGELNLDQRLSDLAPEIEFSNPWEENHPVRLVHLLEHTSGFEDLHLREYAYDNSGITLQEALAFNPYSRAARWPPGMYFSYSNSGPAVAAYIVEKESGQSFEDYVREHIFVPLGMENTAYDLNPQSAARLSKSYTPGRRAAMPYSNILMPPSGGVNSTAGDMMHLIQTLINRGTYQGQVLLSPEAVASMEKPSSSLAARQGLQVGYGLGIFSIPEREFLFYGHDGGIDGFVSDLGYLPEAQSGYFFSLNAASHRASQEVASLIRSYLTRDLAPPDPPAHSAAAEIGLNLSESYSGYYESFTPRQEWLAVFDKILGIVRVRHTGDTLLVNPLVGSAPLRLVPVSEVLFRDPEETLATTAFAADENGLPLMFIRGGMAGNFRATPDWSAVGRLVLAGFSAIMIASIYPVGLVAGLLRFLKRNPRPVNMLLWALPILGATSLILAFMILISTGFPVLGKFSIWTAALWMLTVLFAIFTLAGLAVALASLLRRDISLIFRVYSLLLALAASIALLYLALEGLIGIRTWI